MPTAVSLSQLVDLALGTPEVGAVNLNVLHTLLHAIIAKLNIQDVKADINELDREFLQTYAVPQNREKHGPDKSRDRSGSTDKSSDKKFNVDSRGNMDKSNSNEKGGEKSTSNDKSNRSEKGSFNEKDQVKSVDGSSNEDSFVAPKFSAYHSLEQRVAELAQQMENLNALPSTKELFERSVHEKSSDSLPPVAEMWQTMQLKKRVDVNEEGIGKLMAIMDDTLKEIASLRDVSNALQERPLFDPGELINRQNDLEKIISEMRDRFASFPSSADFQQYVSWPQLEEALLGIRRDIESINKVPKEVVTSAGVQTDQKYESQPGQSSRCSPTGPSSELLEALEKIGNLSNNHDALRKRVDLIEEELMKKMDKDVLQSLSLDGEVLKELNRLKNEMLDLQNCLKDDLKIVTSTEVHERTTNLLTDLPHSIISQPILAKPFSQSQDLNAHFEMNHIENLSVQRGNDDDIRSQLSDLLNQIQELRAQMGKDDDMRSQLSDLLNQIKELRAQMGKDDDMRSQLSDLLNQIKEDSEMVSKLQDMLKKVEKEIENLTITSDELKEDGRKKSRQLERLFGQCDSLELKKADKEYVEMEFDVKADKRHLESKVSYSHFDSTTSEINKMIKDLLEKMSGSESDWKNMLSKLTNDLDGKLDRLELIPLKDWLEAKLKDLSKKIQQGKLEWNEDEAAGLRRQLIQHYHCLSCDKPIDILQGQGTALSLPPGFNRLPGSRTPRPYITYELDQIRQQARNAISPEIIDFYATTRPCGGPHTMTLPHKRLSRMNISPSPYQKEDIVDITPVHKSPSRTRISREEISIMGADGQMYRGRLDARMPTQLVSARQSASYSTTTRGRERPASAKTNAVRKDSAHITSASPQQLPRAMSSSGMYFEKQNGSATFSEKQNGSATFSEKQNGSATFFDKQNGSATFPEKQSGSATFFEKQSGSATFFDKQNGSATFPEKQSGSATFFEKQSGSATFPEKQSGSATFFEKQNGSATNGEKQSDNGNDIPIAFDHPDEIQDMDMSTAEMDNSRQEGEADHAQLLFVAFHAD